MQETESAPGAKTFARAPSALYSAIWRWHFLAGLLCAPFILLLAVTGTIYLYKDEVHDLVFADRYIVAPTGEAAVAPSELVAAAEGAVPGGTAWEYVSPSDERHAAVVRVGEDDVFLDPWRGTVLAVVPGADAFMEVVRNLHSLEILGVTANRVIEAIGGFVLVLVVTGVFLWWPRGRRGGIVTVRGTPRNRMWWRDVHAVTGVFGALAIFFLALSGMPWTGVWGSQFQQIAADMGMGYPPAAWDEVPVSGLVVGDVTGEASWTSELAPVPESGAAAGVPVGVDRAVAKVVELGVVPGFAVSIPDTPEGVYTATVFPHDLSEQRIVHIDQYTGEPLVDLSLDDYGAFALAMEWGINVHMGQEWGLFNQLLMTATTLALIVSVVTGSVMWWRRRPDGKLGMPPAPADRRVYIGLWAIAIVFGVLFPISGLAILAMIAADLLLIRWIPPLRRAFS